MMRPVPSSCVGSNGIAHARFNPDCGLSLFSSMEFRLVLQRDVELLIFEGEDLVAKAALRHCGTSRGVDCEIGIGSQTRG